MWAVLLLDTLLLAFHTPIHYSRSANASNSTQVVPRASFYIYIKVHINYSSLDKPPSTPLRHSVSGGPQTSYSNNTWESCKHNLANLMMQYDEASINHTHKIIVSAVCSGVSQRQTSMLLHLCKLQHITWQMTWTCSDHKPVGLIPFNHRNSFQISYTRTKLINI